MTKLWLDVRPGLSEGSVYLCFCCCVFVCWCACAYQFSLARPSIPTNPFKYVQTSATRMCVPELLSILLLSSRGCVLHLAPGTLDVFTESVCLWFAPPHARRMRYHSFRSCFSFFVLFCCCCFAHIPILLLHKTCCVCSYIISAPSPNRVMPFE